MKSLTSAKKELLKFAVVVLAVSLFAVTVHNIVPQNQTNRQGTGSTVNSGPSTIQSAAYWWSMIRTMASSSATRTLNSTPTSSNASQTVQLSNQSLWTVRNGGESIVAVGDGEVCVGAGGNGWTAGAPTEIFAYNVSTGAFIWFEANGADGPGINPPALAEGIAYICLEGSIYALNDTTGMTVWNFTTGDAYFSTPVVAGGIVYVGSDSVDWALNSTTGTVLWSYSSSGARFGSSTVVNGIDYVPGDSYVWALNSTTGTLEWVYTADDPVGSVAISDGNVFLMTTDLVYSLNASTGGVLWTYLFGWGSNVSVFGDIAYVASANGDGLYALNASTGQQLWSYSTKGFVRDDPAVVGGVLYLDSYDGSIYALNATTGAYIWSYQTGSWISGGSYLYSPCVVDGVVYVGSNDDNVYALNATNGALIWKFNVGGFSVPFFDNGVVFAASSDGTVYAIGLPAFSASISPSYCGIIQGQSEVFSSNARGGSLPYTFQWYLDGSPVSGATDANWTFTPPSVGSYTVYLEVTDNTGAQTISNNATVIAAVSPVFSFLNPGPESNASNWNASATVRNIGTPDFIFYSNETSLGSTFFVNVTVSNVTDLYAWGIGMTYDNTTLQFVNAWLPSDNVFHGATSSGDTLVQPPVVVGAIPNNSTCGVIEWGCTFIQGSENWCFNGTGTLAQIEFRIIKSPTPTAPQTTSAFTFDPDWTLAIYWPNLDNWPEPLLGTGSVSYGS
ncbi:MAG: PQQ-binding-like beta-propeller repeat protein [Candidatus Bathyarchaeia archaeon]|jgi:outer membrane protein assembly factor BamB